MGDDKLDDFIEKNESSVFKPMMSKVAYILEFFKNGDFAGGMEQYDAAENLLAEAKELAKQNEDDVFLYSSTLAYTCNFFHDFKKYVEVD